MARLCSNIVSCSELLEADRSPISPGQFEQIVSWFADAAAPAVENLRFEEPDLENSVSKMNISKYNVL